MNPPSPPRLALTFLRKCAGDDARGQSMAKDDVKPGVAQRTVLTYVKLEFRGQWEYHGSTYSFRPAGKKAELRVVTEAPTDSLRTHVFVVRRRPDPGPHSRIPTDGVIAPEMENIVYIPELCAKVEKGDRTECGS